jgi:hypothetical protein
MTLKQKFSRILPWYSEKDNSNKSNECEKIADDYAIEFLDFAKNETDFDHWATKFDYKGMLYTSKELLEIFKKQKGL